jgi:hypothetical protein
LQNGEICLKFADVVGATKAQAALNGRFFDGRQIEARFVLEGSYLARHPDAAMAVIPLMV